MARLNQFARMNAAIQDEFIERVLAGSPYTSIREWLYDSHGIQLSKTTVSKYGKDIADKFAPLVKLGMPIKTIVENRRQIEALGVEQVREQLRAKLTEQSAALFAHLDDKGADQ